MKRKFVAGIVILALGALLVPAAFAAVDNNQNQANNAANTNTTVNQQWVNQMFDQQKAWLDQAVKDGSITEDQAKTWSQHFEQMKDFHSKNGMGTMMNMMGNGGMMNMMNMMGNGYGMGPGMMGNFNTPASK